MVVAKEVEGGVVATLEGVAEQLSFSESDGKVWVRSAHVNEQSLACGKQKKRKMNERL